MASTREVADQLVALCREDKSIEVVNQYYDANIVSVEACSMGPDKPAEQSGIDAIRQKHEWWTTTFEVLSGEVLGPFMHGDDRFAVIFKYTTKNRDTGKEMSMEEIGVYTVANGKITREEFFYTMDDECCGGGDCK